MTGGRWKSEHTPFKLLFDIQFFLQEYHVLFHYTYYMFEKFWSSKTTSQKTWAEMVIVFLKKNQRISVVLLQCPDFTAYTLKYTLIK